MDAARPHTRAGQALAPLCTPELAAPDRAAQLAITQPSAAQQVSRSSHLCAGCAEPTSHALSHSSLPTPRPHQTTQSQAQPSLASLSAPRQTYGTRSGRRGRDQASADLLYHLLPGHALCVQCRAGQSEPQREPQRCPVCQCRAARAGARVLCGPCHSSNTAHLTRCCGPSSGHHYRAASLSRGA